MKKMLLLFSHKLTQAQKDDARENWNIENFIALPEDLQQCWRNIDPDLESIYGHLSSIRTFLGEVGESGDLVLIQGDFGACYNLVRHAKSKHMIPVYATTKRTVEEYTENEKNIKRSIFEHRRFRKYE